MPATKHTPDFDPNDPEQMGTHIVAYLYDLVMKAREENPDSPHQVFYDCEEIRFAMGIEDADAFMGGLLWAEEKGWITDQSNTSYVQ